MVICWRPVLVRYGARIIVNDITPERAETAVTKLQQEGIKAIAAPFNVTHKQDIEAAVEHIEKDIGVIDVLINNAGIQRRHPFTEFPEQEWNDVIAVNQTAVFLVSQAVTRRMVARQAGKVINICSMQSELGRDTITPYAASKGAVKMLTRGMCVELARHNIQVNGIAPGYFKTEMTKALVEDEAFTSLAMQTYACRTLGRSPGAYWRCGVSLVKKPPTLLTDICCLSMAVCWLPSDQGNTTQRVSAAILALIRETNMPLIIIAAGVALLLVLMIGFKVNGFIALVLVAAVVGFAEGMGAQDVLHSIQNGIGGTLGGLAMILGFGAMLGRLISDTGAAQRIATTLINTFGKKRVQWALVITGLIVGLAMFFEVGFVLLLPLVFTIVASSGLPLLYVGVPMVAALSVTHCFLPPHPGPTAIATIFEANLGTTLLYGLIITIPTVIVAGPLFSKLLARFEKAPPEGLFNPHLFSEEEMPSFWNSIFAAVIPVILMAIAAVCEITLPKTDAVRVFFEFIGNPAVALFIAIIIAIFTLGRRNGRTVEQVMDIVGESIGAIAMIVFIIAGGGRV
ncbi:Gluconate permease [Salmonella bongori]|nr:Gluconate permease [Salmonella bongori]